MEFTAGFSTKVSFSLQKICGYSTYITVMKIKDYQNYELKGNLLSRRVELLNDFFY